MKYYAWDEEKNKKLKAERSIGFEDIVAAIHQEPLDIITHHNPKKYPGQKIYIVRIEDYAYLVPFVEDEEKIFLKTIYPSRKMTKKYLEERE